MFPAARERNAAVLRSTRLAIESNLLNETTALGMSGAAAEHRNAPSVLSSEQSDCRNPLFREGETCKRRLRSWSVWPPHP
jgi:hypothetical protein